MNGLQQSGPCFSSRRDQIHASHRWQLEMHVAQSAVLNLTHLVTINTAWQLSGKPGNVREFDSSREIVTELVKSQWNVTRKIFVRKNYLLLTSLLGLHQCIVVMVGLYWILKDYGYYWPVYTWCGGGGQYCFALWHLSSSSVTLHVGLQAASPAQARRWRHAASSLIIAPR